MPNYEKAKDIFIQRKKTSGTGVFEEYPLIVSPNSVVTIDQANNLTTTPLSFFAQSSASISSSYSDTASYALRSLSASYANYIGTMMTADFALLAGSAIEATTSSFSLSNVPYILLNTTYYVNPTGSNSNNGSSEAAAFQTIQYAVNYISNKFIVNGAIVTIQLTDGVYNENIILPPVVGPSYETLNSTAKGIIINGNSINSGSVVVNGTGSLGYTIVNNNGIYTLQNFKISNTGSGLVHNRKQITVGSGMIFGTSNSTHLKTTDGGYISISGSYMITGGGEGHWGLSRCAVLFVSGTNTITIIGNPTFSNAFVYASDVSSITANGLTFIGGATGSRYSSVLNSVINTVGGGANYFPGTSSGITSAGGQYI